MSQHAKDSKLSFTLCMIKTHVTKSFKIKFVKVDDTKQDDAKAKQLQKELKRELQKRIRQLTLHTVHATLAVCLPLEGTPLSL